jgi:hypothetical protein
MYQNSPIDNTIITNLVGQKSIIIFDNIFFICKMGCSASEPAKQVILLQCANCKKRGNAVICSQYCQNIFVNIKYHKLDNNVTISKLTEKEITLYKYNTYYDSELVIAFFGEDAAKVISHHNLLKMIHI